jgi:hypothetical protein
MKPGHTCLVLFAFALVGGRIEEKKPPSVRVTPEDFFSGPLKRLKPHVDFNAACFKVTTRGPVRCRPTIEMWCDGERVDNPKYGSVDDPVAGELTLSWRWDGPRKGPLRFKLVVGGLTHFGRAIDEPVSRQKITQQFGPECIDKPIELKSVEDSAVVWAMGAGPAVDVRKPAEVKEAIKKAPWIMVLRLTAEKQE